MYKNISKMRNSTLLKEYHNLHKLGVSTSDKTKFKYFCKLTKEIQKRKLDTGEIYFT
jgi:hypothetical protein